LLVLLINLMLQLIDEGEVTLELLQIASSTWLRVLPCS